MTYLILLLLVAVAMTAETIRLLLLHDGRGPLQPPRSHFDDPRFRSPVAR
ncbi:hypothetical protein [Nocardioides sp.]|nr:hypothetical protein [Nocardioides sp.]HET8961317.1 hypothetical protein [Nocardioides sp.]